MNAEEVGALLRLLRLRSVDDFEPTAAWRCLAHRTELVRLLRREDAAIWLHRRLHDLGLERDTPLAAGLRRVAHQHLAAGLRVDAEARQVLDLLHRAGLPVMPIKGPARRIAAERYPYADARSTTDVDLLMPGDVAAHAWQLLQANGYAPVRTTVAPHDDHFHLPGLVGPGGVSVELHTSTSAEVPAAEAWRRQSTDSETVPWNGMDVRIPPATELLWHAVTHAFGDGAEGFRLRTFLDGAVVLAAEVPIDWDALGHRIAAGEVRDAERGVATPSRQVERWLGTAAMLAGVTLPERFAAAGRFRIDRLLRWKDGVLRWQLGRALRDRLLDEATRTEAALGLVPPYRGDGLLVRSRRRAAASLARAGYLGWRAMRGGVEVLP